MPCCLPLIKKKLADKEGNVREEYFFFLPLPLRVLMPPVYCSRWSCSIQSEKYSKPYYFSNRIFGTGTSGSFEGEATRSQHWSEVPLAGRKIRLPLNKRLPLWKAPLFLATIWNIFQQQSKNYVRWDIAAFPDTRISYSGAYVGFSHEINYLSRKAATFEGWCMRHGCYLEAVV